MNRITGIIILIVLLLPGMFGLVAGEVSVDAQSPSLSFPVGEVLKYKIYWGVVPVGYSSATTAWTEEDGRKLLAIRFRTRTNKVLSKLYPVNDKIESIIDPVTFLPVRFTKNLSEGKYRCHEVTTFDHKNGTATMVSLPDKKEKSYEIDPDTRDIVSFMYYMRTLDFPIGKTVKARVMADERVYDIEIDVLGKDRVKIVDGKRIPCVKLEPKASFEGLFVRKGRMTLWVSEQKPSVVTRMSAKIPVASIKLVLENFEFKRTEKEKAQSRATAFDPISI